MADINYPGLHRWHHDDYDQCKQDIFDQIGRISESCVFGRQVLCAVYVRPILNPASGIYSTVAQQNEDVAQGKTMMIMQCGPSAFKGDEAWLSDTYGEWGAPRVGDWVFARANMGELIHVCGEIARRVTFRRRPNDDPQESYPWVGWACRVLADDSLIGRVDKPHHIV